MFHEKSYDSTFTNVTLDISKVTGVLFITECYYYGESIPYGSKEKSTYDNVIVLISDSYIEDPAFAYDFSTEIEYPERGIRVEYAD